MKPNSSKPNPPAQQIHLNLNPETQPELEQGLTFQTVDDLLSYDRSETEVPTQITRRLRSSLPATGMDAAKPKPSKPWHPRTQKPD